MVRNFTCYDRRLLLTRCVRNSYKDENKTYVLIVYFSDPVPLSCFIAGCVVAVRARGHKIALGLTEARNETIVHEVGRRWRSIMNLPTNIRIQFDMHNESSSDSQRPMYEEYTDIYISVKISHFSFFRISIIFFLC